MYGAGACYDLILLLGNVCVFELNQIVWAMFSFTQRNFCCSFIPVDGVGFRDYESIKVAHAYKRFCEQTRLPLGTTNTWPAVLNESPLEENIKKQVVSH